MEKCDNKCLCLCVLHRRFNVSKLYPYISVMSISIHTLIWQKMDKAKRRKDVVFDSPSGTTVEGNGKKTEVVSIQGMEKTTNRGGAEKKTGEALMGRRTEQKMKTIRGRYEMLITVIRLVLLKLYYNLRDQ
jgi:hypothetical protein